MTEQFTTVRHRSAYTIVRATNVINGKGRFMGFKRKSAQEMPLYATAKV